MNKKYFFILIATIFLLVLISFCLYKAKDLLPIKNTILNKQEVATRTNSSDTQGIQEKGTIFVIGGFTKDPGGKTLATNSAEFFNLKINKWQFMPSTNQGHAGGVVASNGNKIYAFGGASGNVWGGTTTTEEFDIATNTWTFKREMPHARFFAQAINLGGKIYILGGQANASVDKLLDIYDPNTDTWTSGPDLPVDLDEYVRPRCEGIGDKIYCPGIAEHAYTLVYDSTTNVWSSLPTDGRAILYHPSWASNDTILAGASFFGDDIHKKNEIVTYDPSLDKLTIKSAGDYIHPSYQSFRPLLLDNTFYLIGGEFTSGPVRDVYIFDLKNSLAWKKTTPLLLPRSNPGVVFLSTNYNGIKIGGGSIGGYLTKNGKPISGRFMKLYIGGNDYINNEVASTRTDANGHYNFTSLKPAIYHVGKEDVKGDSSYSVGYDAKGNPIVEYTDITFNVLKQTSGITLADKQVINDLNFGVDWPSNYQEVPGKYTDNLSKYTGVPLK